uniref:Capsid protein n=1 Tax=Cressdnavirus D_HF4_2562 TaxID=3071201 RepID=A0AA50KJ63_9VIRU|nr:capsid protein [Cressdnavirus D_HF4_2562]
MYKALYVMPYRRRIRRTRAPRRRFRKTFRRRFGRRFGRGRVPRRRVVSTARKLVRLRFSQYVSLTSETMSTPYFCKSFRADDIYDPSISGGALLQPYGYDQWCQFYPNWVVVSSKMSFTCLGGGVNTIAIPFGVALAVSNNDGNSIPSGWAPGRGILEQPDVSWRIITDWSGNSKPARVRMRYNAKKYWGLSKLVDNSQLWGQTSSSPGSQTFYNLYGFALDGTADLDPLQGMVVMDFVVMFRNPNLLLPS